MKPGAQGRRDAVRDARDMITAGRAHSLPIASLDWTVPGLSAALKEARKHPREESP